jgi:uncharacterized protein YfcZ (UPF0381/DUF406 family)
MQRQTDHDEWIDTHAQVSRRRRRIPVRCCSFCREDDHFISNCNSPRFSQFEMMLLQKKVHYLHRENGNVVHAMNEFETWLCTINDRALVRAYATRYCGGYARDSIDNSVSFIIRKIWREERSQLLEENRIEVPEIIEAVNQFVHLVTQLRDNDPNEVTDTQQHLLGDVITWLIDRNPDYTLLERLRNNTNNKKMEVVCLHQESKEKEETEECSICYELTEYSNQVKLNCHHEFCGGCVKKIIEKNNQPCCAFCRVPIEKIKVKSTNMEQIFHEYKK